MRPKTYLAQRVTRTSYLGLIALVGASQLWPTLPASPGLWAWFALSLLPLLAFANGMRRQDPRSIMLASLVSLLYFCHAVVTLMGTAGNRDAAAVELLLSVALFFAGVLFARWRSEELKETPAT